MRKHTLDFIVFGYLMLKITTGKHLAVDVHKVFSIILFL